MPPETTISEKEIFQGHIIRLSVRQAKLQNGIPVQREIIRTNGGVVIVPLAAGNLVRMVKQYRVAAEKWVIELPAGTLTPGEDPALAAPRELLEETGDQADTWQDLGGIYTAPGILTERLSLYLATGLKPGPNQLDFDEHIEVLTIPWKRVLQMIREGEIEDAKTISGLTKAGLYLNLLG